MSDSPAPLFGFCFREVCDLSLHPRSLVSEAKHPWRLCHREPNPPPAPPHSSPFPCSLCRLWLQGDPSFCLALLPIMDPTPLRYNFLRPQTFAEKQAASPHRLGKWADQKVDRNCGWSVCCPSGLLRRPLCPRWSICPPLPSDGHSPDGALSSLLWVSSSATSSCIPQDP